jgi:hypothetical protein
MSSPAGQPAEYTITPRSNNPAGKLLVLDSSGDFVEAVFQVEIFRIFSDDFQSVLLESRGSWQESTGKNTNNFRSQYWFHIPAKSGVFQQDLVTFPHLSFRILLNLVAGIIELGS